MKPTSLRPHLTGLDRAKAAQKRRFLAADLSQSPDRPPFEASDNGDNATFDKLPLAFTKGLEHNAYGILEDPGHYAKFEQALTQKGPDGAETDFKFDVPGTKVQPGFSFRTMVKGTVAKARTWESPLCGVTYVEEGPDPGSVAMPPAPRLGSSELCAEMAEVYAMALVRDMSFEELSDRNKKLYYIDDTGAPVDHTLDDGSPVTVGDLIDAFNKFNWFKPDGMPFGGEDATLSTHLTEPEMLRRKRGHTMVTAQDTNSLFRGSAPGVQKGDYLSKFLTLATVAYGAHTINQRIYPAKPGLDYMSNWTAWLDVQNGANLKEGGAISDEDADCTVIKTGRHLARYVHVDQLYQAYHIAALVLAQSGFTTSVGFPENGEHPTRDAFATFGGPHVLALFAEVSSRALKAVRRQKFQIHRRGRPERLAAMITLAANGHSDKLGTAAPVVDNMLTELKDNFGPFLELIAKHNARQNGTPWSSIRASEGKIELTEMGTFEPHPDKNYLLPMAFAEGSPMHPSYGAGHAAVAGACVTVLKAFFKTVDPDNSWTQTLMSEIDAEKVKGLKDIKDLTVEGELNKLAANIAIGRDMAGVHYYSDYYESLRLGERIAVGILHEQMSNYNEPVSMYLKSFDGDRITIKTDGKFDVELDVEGKTADWWLRNTGQTPGPSLSNWQGL